jgi:hypothetical protein
MSTLSTRSRSRIPDRAGGSRTSPAEGRRRKGPLPANLAPDVVERLPLELVRHALPDGGVGERPVEVIEHHLYAGLCIGVRPVQVLPNEPREARCCGQVELTMVRCPPLTGADCHTPAS